MPTSDTVIAFDYGLRQIGVAVGNRQTRSSQALTTLRARDGVPDWNEIKRLLEEWQPNLAVVGEPYNMDDTPAELAPRANKFARRLHGRFGIAMAMVDERLTSREAKSLLHEQGHRGDYHDKPADALAAQLILQTWLNELPD